LAKKLRDEEQAGQAPHMLAGGHVFAIYCGTRAHQRNHQDEILPREGTLVPVGGCPGMVTDAAGRSASIVDRRI
jgi:hypothetical protein